MINKQTALSALPLAMMADAKGVMIVPVAGTPLADLVTITTNGLTSFKYGTEQDLDAATHLQEACSLLEFSTCGNDGILSNHDRSIDCYVPELAKAVTSHISFAKNIVMPVVMQMADTVKKEMEVVVSASAEFCINTIDLPIPMRSSSFEEVVSKYNGRVLIKPERDLALAAMTAEGILELIKTGSKITDTEIELWYAGVSGDLATCVWNNVFRDFKTSNPAVVKSIEELFKDPVDGINASLLVFLISRKLYDEVPEETGMTLVVYKDVVSQIRDYSGTMLSNEYNRYNASVRNKTLIIGFSPNRKTINVNGAVYREWLKTGGNNEIILGMVVSNTPLYSVTLIDASADKFVAAWNTYEQYSNTAAKNNSFNKFKQILKICFARDLANLSEIEKDLLIEKPSLHASVSQYFEEEMEKLRTNDMLDIHNECLKLVCRSRFYYTDAEKILQGINDAVKMNPNINIRDAAAMATCEYVFDYISDQMRVVG